MSGQELPSETAAGRPRSAQAHAAILRAAMAVMRERGFRGLTIEAIAGRAGVGKNTIYRRWRTPAAVMLEALVAETRTEIAAPDLGDVAGDVVELLSQAFRRLSETDTGDVVRAVMAEAQFDDRLRGEMRRVFIADRRAALAALIERGRQREQIDAGADVELLVDLLYGAMWYRLLNGHAPLDRSFAERITAAVLGRVR